MTFAEAVADLEVDDTKFHRQMARLTPADRSCLVVFTPRSGSSWLAGTLGGTKVLGDPREYFNDHFLRQWAKAMNTRDRKGLLQMLKRRQKTENGVFCAKVTSTHVTMFGEELFFEVFGKDTVMFNLYRSNIVSQGISLYRAVKTNRFHSDDKKQTEAVEPEYDGEQIRDWIRHTMLIENENCAMLERRGFTAQPLCYEGMVQNEEQTLLLFCDALKVDKATLPEKLEKKRDLIKIGDTWNEDTEARFRREENEFIAQIESQRMILTNAQSFCPPVST